MARKLSAGIGSLFGAAFTGVAAPVLVTLLTQLVKIDTHSAPPSRGDAVAVEGIGKTPDEAVRNGLRDAVRAVAGSIQTEPRDEARFRTVLRDSGDVVLSWEEKGGRMEAWPHGLIHRRNLEVVVDRATLAERLKTPRVAWR